MKQIMHNLLTAIAVIGMWAFACGNLYAQVPVTLNFQVTATVQGSTNYSGSGYTVPTTTVKITTKDILTLAGNVYSQNFSGSKLVLYEGDVWVVNSSGSYLYDLTFGDVLWIWFYPDDFEGGYSAFDSYVFGEKYNGTTCAESYTDYGTTEIFFCDYIANEIDCYGLAQEVFSFKGCSHGTISDKLTFTGYGGGFVGDQIAVFSEKVTMSGKETY